MKIRLIEKVNKIFTYTDYKQLKDKKNVKIPYEYTEIGESVFYGCIDLTHITIPDSVTSIGEDAFAECDSLTDIAIPYRFKDKLDFIGIDTSETKVYYVDDKVSITLEPEEIEIDDEEFWS